MTHILLVKGDNVAGGAQIVQNTTRTLADLVACLRRQVAFDNPEHSRITAVLRYDPRFAEWVPLAPDLEGLLEEDKIQIVCQPTGHTAREQAFLEEVIQVLLGCWGADRKPVLERAIEAARRECVATDGSIARFAACDSFRGFKRLAQEPPGDAAARSVEVCTTPQTEPTFSTARRIKVRPACRPSTAPSGSREATPVADAPRRPSTATGLVEAAATPSTVTAYCVYSGTTSQRAKAVQVSRYYPDFPKLLNTLRQKFGTDLVLGHIDERGDCVDLHSSTELEQLLASKGDARLTLHCWAKPNPIHFDPSAAASSLGREPSNRRCTPQRPDSAVSRLSELSAIVMTPASVASGVPSNTSQLRDLFQRMDTDNRGVVTRDDLLRYFRTCHDPMGVVGAEKNFEKLLHKRRGSRYEFTFDEFVIVMLRLAQW